MKEIDNFIEALNKSNKKVWIRQVIIPNINDNEKYIDSLVKYIKKIKNIEKWSKSL
jgi:pyruvate formate lyase activating enzyme